MRGIRLPRWMYPGMHIKRWLLLAFVGITILGLGAAIFLVDLYRRFGADNIPIVFWLTGAGIERPIRAVIVGIVGLLLTGFGVWGLMRSVVSPFVTRGDSVLEVLYTKRYLARGPRIVAIGGGTGLSTWDAFSTANRSMPDPSARQSDFEEAVRESNRVLAVRGQVLPATSVPLNLSARLASGRRIDGQVGIGHAKEPIERVFIEPADVRANPEALERILEADMVVIGPGSLYSSVLPNLLISDIRDALAAAPGMRVYVCNVATQPGETGSFSAAEHLEALFEHIGEGLIDYVLINHNWHARQPDGWLGEPVQIDERRLEELPVVVIEEDLVDVANAHRHDSAKLAAALVRLQQEDRLERPRQRRLRRPAASAS